MNLKRHFYLLVLLSIIAFLSISNPSESTYLTRVSNDYSHFHHEVKISTEILQKIGTSERTSFFLFSTYEYRFGGVKVYYLGVANSIYYVGIQKRKIEQRPIKIVSLPTKPMNRISPLV